MLNTCKAAIAAVVPTPIFVGEIYTYDRGRVDAKPGVTMAYEGSKRTDDFGARAAVHRHQWQHTFMVRLWFYYDANNSPEHEAAMQTGVQAFVDAFEEDPTLGGRVVASAVSKVDTPAILLNHDHRPVAKAVDVTVHLVCFGAWQ